MARNLLRIVGQVSGTVSIWTQKWLPRSMPSGPNSRKNDPFLYIEVYCCKFISELCDERSNFIKIQLKS